MLKYVLAMDFLVQGSNATSSGRLGKYAFKLSGNNLSLIYPKRSRQDKGLSFGFEMNLDIYGVVSLICFIFEVQVTTSTTGYLYDNSRTFNKLLESGNDFDILNKSRTYLKTVSRLDASDPTLLFSSSSTTTFNTDHLDLGQRMQTDLLNYVSTSPNKIELFTQLNYWRRAHDLDDLHFDKEAFLNYFKIIENILKDTPLRKLGDSYVHASLKSLKLAKFTKHVCFYRNLRNKFDVGHSVRSVMLQRDYDQYLDDMNGFMWNHLSDLEQFTKVLILHKAGYFKYFLENEGGLLFARYRY